MKKILLGLVLITALLGNACTRVDAGYVGIEVDLAGSQRGVQDLPIKTGWVFYSPVGTQIFQYPTFVQTAKWTRDPNEGRPVNEEITFTVKGEMVVSVDVSLSYSLVPEKVPAFYLKFRTDDLGAFTHGFLRNLARDHFNEAGGKYTIEQVMGDNADFIQTVRGRLQNDLDSIGVKIEQFGFIGAARPPQLVIDSINAKIMATQLAQQKQNELVTAQAEAAKTVATAEGNARSILVEAEAQAKANELLNSTLSDRLVQVKWIEKWNGQQPTVTGGSNLVSIPIPKQ